MHVEEKKKKRWREAGGEFLLEDNEPSLTCKHQSLEGNVF